MSLDLELTVHIIGDKRTAHTMVTIRFGKVQLACFTDFNFQNVIDDLTITHDETSVHRFAVDIPQIMARTHILRVIQLT
jgi:hypothetical protein